MSLPLTKVRLPKRRRDLLDRLHSNLHRKVTFISAPAGYGKTALLLDFAADVEAVVCWYSIGADDAEPATFARYLSAAFAQRFPDFGRRLSALLDAPHDQPDGRTLAIELVNEMSLQAREFCVLMLDDYHTVGEAPAIAELMDTLIENLPDHVRLVIAGRGVHGIPAAALYVQGELATLNRDDLRFRADELRGLVQRTHRVSLSDDDARALAERTDGWAVAILLGARALEGGAGLRLPWAEGALRAYLAEEVLARQPAEVRDLLLATSIVDEFSQPLCDHLLESQSTGELLHELEARNLFVMQVDSDGAATYRYHHLFADFLRGHLWATDSARARALNRRAAEWFVARQNWPPAIRHALTAGERERAAAWMDQAALELRAAGQVHAFGAWLEALAAPSDLRPMAPRLLLAQAKTLIDQGLGESAEPLLDMAESELRRSGDADELADTLLSRGYVLHFRGRVMEALALAQAAASQPLDPRGVRAYLVERLTGTCLSQLGQVEAGIHHLQTAIAGLRQLDETHYVADAATDLGVVQFERGNLLEAQRCFMEVLDIRRRLSHRGSLALALNNAGSVFHQAGQYAHAWRYYAEALEAAKSVRFTRMVALVLDSQAGILRDVDEWEAARANEEAALQIAQACDNRQVLVYTCGGLCELERLCGNFDQAMHWLREAARHRGEGTESPAYQAGLGAVYLSMGQHALAQEALRQALESWRTVATPRQEQVLAAFHLAQAYFEGDQPEQALQALAQCLQSAARLGVDQCLVVAGRRARNLLGHAQQAWPDHAQLRSLVDRVEGFKTGQASLQAEAPGVPARDEVLRFEVTGFGAGRILRNGEPIPAPAWASERSRVLFFYLIGRGDVRKEDVILDLWPDVQPAKVNSNFHVTLWRLREAVGHPLVSFDGERYRLMDSIQLWNDVAEFDAAMRRAGTPGRSALERVDDWRRAADLYRGDFLSDAKSEWAESRRHELQAQVLQALAGLAEWEFGRRHYPQAREWYQRIADTDPYLDEAHAGIIECLAREGSHSEALSRYTAYTKALKRELGTVPSAALQALGERLRLRRGGDGA